MGKWAALAEQHATDIHEPGYGAATSVAAAWAMRIDPMATRSLTRAALILTDGEAAAALWAKTDPCPDAATLLEWGEELQSHIGDLLKRGLDTGTACHEEYDAAVEAQAAALHQVRHLEHALATAKQQAKKALLAAIKEARTRAKDAARVVADTGEALELLGMVDCKLRSALDCARAFPAEYAEVYEPVHELVGAGGKLPHSGDFIAPAETTLTGANDG